MTPTPEQVALHMSRFLDMLDAAFRGYGMPGGLPEQFRNAVAATPRRMFVHVSDPPKAVACADRKTFGNFHSINGLAFADMTETHPQNHHFGYARIWLSPSNPAVSLEDPDHA